MTENESVCYRRPGTEWVEPVQLTPGTLARVAARPETLRGLMGALRRLTPDDYLEFMLGYYEQGLARFGADWGYLDILNVLHGAALVLQPRDYLEIGVRRGRSIAAVVAAAPGCAVAGFDLWVRDYAGMPNPGPDFVRAEIARVDPGCRLELVSGDSAETVPAFAAREPGRTYDLITVDGDHSEAGARRDLAHVIPLLKRGGVLVLDDVAHPQHPELPRVWHEMVVRDARFAAFDYRELGYGVAFAVRRS